MDKTSVKLEDVIEEIFNYIDTVATNNNLICKYRDGDGKYNYRVNGNGKAVLYMTKSSKSVKIRFMGEYLPDDIDNSWLENMQDRFDKQKTFKDKLSDNDKLLINHVLQHVSTVDSSKKKRKDINVEPMETNTESSITDRIYPLNFIVYGAPGTGKTYSMVEYALAIVENVPLEEFQKKNPNRKSNVDRYKKLVKDKRVVFTTFHQNYGYEDFIQGLRPNIDKKVENENENESDNDTDTNKNDNPFSFKIEDGVFKVIADMACKDSENNYVIIIDEINRANISKVFGELITLIEEDKRWGEINEMSVTLQSGENFVVPNNLYIIGTMNSADKSISLIDAALRRRFEFIEQKPDSSLIEDSTLRKIFESINEKLVEELDSTDLLVGHSYFMNKTEKDLCKILNNNIIPLVYEYFYDNRKKVNKLIEHAIDKSGAKVEIDNEKFGRLRVKDKVQ